MEGIEISLMLGGSFLVLLPIILSKIMDDLLNDKELLMNWRNFWISVSLSMSLMITSMLQAFSKLNKTITIAEYHTIDPTIDGLFSQYSGVFNTISNIQMIIVMIWFSYLAVTTVIFYINKLSQSGDKIKYE